MKYSEFMLDEQDSNMKEFISKDELFKWIDNELKYEKDQRLGCKRIRIIRSDMTKSFERYISDVTEWDGYMIISWFTGSEKE